MSHGFHVLHVRQRDGQGPLLLLLVACLLISIRVVAGFVCFTCFTDFEKPTNRSFHLHAGGDQNPCHHGKVEASPLISWACAVTQDESAFILPEIPQLPVSVSVFVPLVLLLVSYRTLFLIAATGRGPPFSLI